MRFWDSSAIVPMLSRQAASQVARQLLLEDNEVTVWWGTWAECAVAISRLQREGGLGEETEGVARARLDRLADEWAEIDPSHDLRLLAALISKDYPLKTADCLQLAAALRWCGDAANAAFVCLDTRLRDAAKDEGFVVLPEPSGIG